MVVHQAVPYLWAVPFSKAEIRRDWASRVFSLRMASRASNSACSSRAFGPREKAWIRWKMACSAVSIFARTKQGLASAIALFNAICHKNSVSCCTLSPLKLAQSLRACEGDVTTIVLVFLTTRRRRRKLGGFSPVLLAGSIGGWIEAADRGAVENSAVRREAGAVARTIPALLEGVPGDDAAQMSANGGQFVKLV